MLPVIQANINFPAGQPNVILILQQIQIQLAGLTAQVNGLTAQVNVLTAQGNANAQAIAGNTQAIAAQGIANAQAIAGNTQAIAAQGIANTQAIAALGVNLRMEIRNSTLLAVNIGRSTTDRLLMLYNAQGMRPTAPLLIPHCKTDIGNLLGADISALLIFYGIVPLQLVPQRRTQLRDFLGAHM
jgi:hypothetical protein